LTVATTCGGSHPEIDQVDLGVAADDVEVAPGGRDPRDVHRIAGVEHVDDLVGAAVDQGDLAGVAQGHREQVVDVDVVLRCIRPVGLFVERAFCRYLCPLAAAFAIPAKIRQFEWLKRHRQCGAPCQICAVDCPVQAIHPEGRINPQRVHLLPDLPGQLLRRLGLPADDRAAQTA
jgi:ferredoxin